MSFNSSSHSCWYLISKRRKIVKAYLLIFRLFLLVQRVHIVSSKEIGVFSTYFWNVFLFNICNSYLTFRGSVSEGSCRRRFTLWTVPVNLIEIWGEGRSSFNNNERHLLYISIKRTLPSWKKWSLNTWLHHIRNGRNIHRITSK